METAGADGLLALGLCPEAPIFPRGQLAAAAIQAAIAETVSRRLHCNRGVAVTPSDIPLTPPPPHHLCQTITTKRRKSHAQTTASRSSPPSSEGRIRVIKMSTRSRPRRRASATPSSHIWRRLRGSKRTSPHGHATSSPRSTMVETSLLLIDLAIVLSIIVGGVLFLPLKAWLWDDN